MSLDLPGLMRRWVSASRQALRSELWPVPAIGVLVGLVVGIVLPKVDSSIDRHLPHALSQYLFGGGASAAREVLGVVASSLVTVTSLTFSLTVVTLQLASGQFSPRLLRTFTRDRTVHFTLALFLATFVYALAVLRTVRSAQDQQQVFVPQVAVTVGFVLCIASVLALVLFLAHLASEIRVETMLKNVHEDASATASRVSHREEPGARDSVGPDAPKGAALLLAGSSGFLLKVDGESLLAAAVSAGAVVLIDRASGASLIAGTPFGAVWAHGDPLEDDALERVQAGVDGAASIGFERTEEQDLGYGMRQLADVTIKALSPGINDPTTAIHALGHCSGLLCELAGRDLGPKLLCDEDGATRVVLARPGFGELLEIAVGQARRFADDPMVLHRLFALLREVTWRAPGTHEREAIREQLGRLRATAADLDLADAELAELREHAALVEEALAGSWPLHQRS